jgi:hypothetical protein
MCTEAEKNPAHEGEAKNYVSAAEEGVIVRAARLRLSTDSKQGIVLPGWVKTIAKRPI